MREEVVRCDICGDKIDLEKNQEVGSITIWNDLYEEGGEEPIDTIEFEAHECCWSCISVIHKKVVAAVKKIKKDKKNG